MHNPVDTIVIDAANVTLRLGRGEAAVDILRGVDLRVRSGESVAILGPSGSGKSSLMAILSGLERATSGQVQVAGNDFTKLDEDGLARARRGRIGIVLQAFHLIPTMTALENVAVPLELAGHADPFTRARAELEAVGLGHRLSHYPAQLSGGEQQRVAIARAIAKRPAVLMCDEPTGALDVRTGMAVLEAIERINRELGTLTLIITHNSVMAEMADRVLTLSDGHITGEKRNAARAPASSLAW